MITQIHLQLRDRFGILYWFGERGDGLPFHKHTPELDHDVMCTSGKIRVTIEQHNGVVRHEDMLPGMYLALPVESHSITALVDGSSFIGIFKRGEPPEYKRLPVSERFTQYERKNI